MNAKATALPVVFLLFSLPCEAQVGGFGGPAVLSRGTRPQGRDGPRPIYFSGFASLSATYSSGLTAPATDAQGNLLNDESFGAWLGYSVSGSRQGRRDAFFGTFSGGYRLYADDSYYDGASQALTLAYSRQLSRRWTMFLSQRATASNTLLDSTTNVSTDDPTAELPPPVDEVLDTGYVLLSSAAGVSYQKSARMSFSFSTGFLSQRRSNNSLASTNGVIGTANMSYMMSRRQQIGIYYSYGSYYFSRGFGEQRTMSLGMSFGRALSPRWSLNGAAGANYLDAERLTRVPVDPYITLITGQRDTIEIYRGSRFGFTGMGSLTGRFRLASVNLGYFRGLTPGNGLYLGAERESVSLRVGVSTVNRASLSFGADVTRYKALTQNIDSSRGYGANVNGGYRLFSFVHATGTVGYRKWEVDATNFVRNHIYASVGLSFGSPSIPLVLW